MKYKKRPVIVEAYRWFPGQKDPEPAIISRGAYGWAIKTLEGYMEIIPGDWVITGVAGERYSCKDSIFIQTYECVPEDTHLECDNCGERPKHWGLLQSHHIAGDQCPCCYLDDYDCDGILVEISSAADLKTLPDGVNVCDEHLKAALDDIQGSSTCSKEEGYCFARDDQTHCEHWWEGETCCDCDYKGGNKG